MPEQVLNYRVEGSGPPLLLVHGFGISFNIWGGLIPLLRQQFTLVVIELPGIGASEMAPEGQSYLQACIEALDTVRQHLGIQRWNVLGYSTGSRIAEAYVQAQAQHVCRAIFLCPLWIDPRKERALRLGLRLDDRWPRFGTWILSGWRLRFLISWLGFNLRSDPRSGEWYSEIGAVPVGVLKATIRATAAAAGKPFSMPGPYAMIWGDQDLVPMTPRWPSQHDYIVHGRHAAPVESSEEIARLIIQLLQEQQAADGC